MEIICFETIQVNYRINVSISNTLLKFYELRRYNYHLSTYNFENIFVIYRIDRDTYVNSTEQLWPMFKSWLCKLRPVITFRRN